MRAVVLDEAGQPALAEIPEPDGDGEPVRVLACGLCGSDVEKLRPEYAGAVLGHEVVAETADGRRVALLHHRGCGKCKRCRSGHESTCKDFQGATIRPGGFAERANARGWVELADGIGDAAGTAVEPLACVLRGAERVPRGRVLVVGHGFIGHLFSAVLTQRGDEVFAVDSDPRRTGRAPDGPIGAAVLCAQGGVETALDSLEPGGTLLVFADAGPIPAHQVYRDELTILGSRSSAESHMRVAAALLPELDLPEPAVLPLSRFVEGLELYRRRDALKVVFTP
ncbi:MAG: alcohol dehydrogenase catalytic domain-containing protein [Gaiellaceae bacterium]